MNKSIRSFRTPAVALSALTACAVALSACAPTDDSTPGSGDPAASDTTMAATAGSTTQSGAATQTSSAAVPANPQTAEAGVAPVGDADLAMKTLRPEPTAMLVPTGVRVGVHEGFERVVFDLEGEGTPGWFIDYTDSPAQQGSGNAVDFNGAVALNVNIDGTTYPFEMGMEDPHIGTVQGKGGIVTEIISLGTFEARSQFVIGLDAKHAYSVEVLQEPTRLVIDIFTR